MAEGRTTITIRPDLTEYRELLKALNRMEKEAQVGLKDDVYAISEWTAKGMRQAASAHQFYPRQAELVAATIKPARDRVPTVRIGGSKKMPVSRKITKGNPAPTAGQLLFGNEFGGNRNAYGNLNAFPNGGFRFPPRTAREGRGNTGYWIFPTLKGMQDDIYIKWDKAVRGVMNLWTRGS